MTSKKTTNNTSIPTSLDGTAAAPAKAPKGRAPRTSTTAVTHKHKKAVSATEDAVAPPTVPPLKPRFLLLIEPARKSQFVHIFMPNPAASKGVRPRRIGSTRSRLSSPSAISPKLTDGRSVGALLYPELERSVPLHRPMEQAPSVAPGMSPWLNR